MNLQAAVEAPELPRPSPPRLWLAAVLLFGVGDLLTTAVGLTVPGIVEADPVARHLLERFGLASLLGLKAAAFAACYLVWTHVPRPHRRGVPLGLALLGAVVTAWNTFVVASTL